MRERADSQQPSQIIRAGSEAAELAREVTEEGGIIAFRTDTFYGLGADPFKTDSVTRINRLKEREGLKPVLVVISDLEIAARFISEKSRLFDGLSEHYWPGALTIVVRALSSVPSELTAGTGTVGLRLPLDEEVREFVRSCGGALTATSANAAGQPPARTAIEVAQYFPFELDLIIDDGAARTDKPSTVIDISQGRVRLIREGVVARSALEQKVRALGADFE